MNRTDIVSDRESFFLNTQAGTGWVFTSATTVSSEVINLQSIPNRIATAPKLVVSSISFAFTSQGTYGGNPIKMQYMQASDAVFTVPVPVPKMYLIRDEFTLKTTYESILQGVILDPNLKYLRLDITTDDSVAKTIGINCIFLPRITN